MGDLPNLRTEEQDARQQQLSDDGARRAAEQTANANSGTIHRRDLSHNEGEDDELDLIENAIREAGITASQRLAPDC